MFLITGRPGIGKTTVVTKTANILKERGCYVGGMLSREVRENGVRIGFEILDLSSQKRGWLAHVNQKIGPQVGKYHVNLTDLEIVGAQAILNAIENCDVIAIDEIGPMELFSQKFKIAVETALESRKLVIAVVHWKAKDKLITDTKARTDAQIFEVTAENRETIIEEIAKNLAQKTDTSC